MGPPEATEEQAQYDGDPGVPPDESPYKKVYLAIDGIEANDLSESEKDSLERHVIEFLLTDLGKPITGVRVVEDGEGVIEFDTDAGLETDE
jgi:hypothetical protein